MRIGLIGVGRIGVFHASTLRGLPGVDTLIITDADLDLILESWASLPDVVARQEEARYGYAG